MYELKYARTYERNTEISNGRTLRDLMDSLPTDPAEVAKVLRHRRRLHGERSRWGRASIACSNCSPLAATRAPLA